MKEAFDCKRCGHCCYGEGGIVLAQNDLARLLEHLGLSESDFFARYVRKVPGKPMLASREDGWCVFYSEGCSVHQARPDVCRAWPYFRGNLIDEQSFSMAAEDCPGIDAKAGFPAFRSQGLAYLRYHGLCRNGQPGDPNALIIDDEQD